MRNPVALGDLTPAVPTSSLIAIRQRFDEQLNQVDVVFQRELSSEYAHVNDLVEHVSGYRGKRLRPLLVLLVADATGGVRDDHIVLAAVVEMIHTATLIHDDVLDEATVRRHKPTVQVRWGNQSSVLLGDHLFTHAFHLAASLESNWACRMIGRATNKVCEGELGQIHNQGNLDLTEADYLQLIGGKTAELCSVCCRLAAHCNRVSDELEEQLSLFGFNLGIAFQIQDDILDLVGAEDMTGKSLGTDLKQRKLTLPLIHLLRESSEELAKEIRHKLCNSNGDQPQLLSYLEEYGSIEYACELAERYARSASARLERLEETTARALLQDLTGFVVRRSS